VPCNWQAIVDTWEASRPGRMNVRKLVHLAMRMDSYDESLISSNIFKQKRKSYEDTLTALAIQVGCRRGRGVATGSVLSDIKRESNSEATGIVNTYNCGLAHAVNAIYEQNKFGNRHYYAKFLQIWDVKRMEWKSKQISMHNLLGWRNRATQDFIKYNDLTGTTELYPQDTGVNAVCKHWRARGLVSISEVENIMDDWPIHANCPHDWRIFVGKVRDCDSLWLGRDPLYYGARELEIAPKTDVLSIV